MTQKVESAKLPSDGASKPQFYRRKLPDICISFSSEEGKKIFKEALTTGHMDCYFKLAAQFRTQDEPAFCGLSTLVMVLNALEIDPERVWKGPWRWYHENMLDCCVPVKVVEQEGINFSQYVCLAECNGLETLSGYADEKLSLESFRDIILRYTKQDESLITLSYSRKVLGQTGDGHFSPVGGYHPERDLMLIMDTARFKYPPHWVPVSLMFEAMQAKDKSTGNPRGYVVMTKQPKTQLLLLFRISDSFGVTLKNACCESIDAVLKSWKDWLSQTKQNGENIEEVTTGAVSWLLQSSRDVLPGQFIFTTQLDIKCPRDVSTQHVCAIETLIDELEKNNVFEIVNNFLNRVQTNGNLDMFGMSSVTTTTCCGYSPNKSRCLQSLKPSHYISLFLLCWPYQTSTDLKCGTNAYVLNNSVCKMMSSLETKYLGNEVKFLRKQFTVLLGTQEKCCQSDVCSKTCT